LVAPTGNVRIPPPTLPGGLARGLSAFPVHLGDQGDQRGALGSSTRSPLRTYAVISWYCCSTTAQGERLQRQATTALSFTTAPSSPDPPARPFRVGLVTFALRSLAGVVRVA